MTLQDNHPKQIQNIVPVIECSNLSETIAYYVEKLGFELGFEWFDEEYNGPTTYAILHHNGKCIHAVQAEAGEEVHPVRLYLFCLGLDAYFNEFRANGAEIDGDWQDFPMGTAEFDVIDPDGHRLTFGEADE